jgi:hypothetical protein
MPEMSSYTVFDVLRTVGSPLRDASGLPKNVRKRRNKKIMRAFYAGGSGGVRSLLDSGDFNQYINPDRFPKKVKASVKPQALQDSGYYSPSMLSGTGTGGWGRLPNVSQIDYAHNDTAGWVHVGRHRRRCQIEDE